MYMYVILTYIRSLLYLSLSRSRMEASLRSSSWVRSDSRPIAISIIEGYDSRKCFHFTRLKADTSLDIKKEPKYFEVRNLSNALEQLHSRARLYVSFIAVRYGQKFPSRGSRFGITKPRDANRDPRDENFCTEQL